MKCALLMSLVFRSALDWEAAVWYHKPCQAVLFTVYLAQCFNSAMFLKIELEKGKLKFEFWWPKANFVCQPRQCPNYTIYKYNILSKYCRHVLPAYQACVHTLPVCDCS